MENPPSDQNLRILIVDDNRTIHGDFLKILAGGSAPDQVDALEAALFGASAGPRPSVRFELDSAYQGEEALALVQHALAAGRPYAMAFMDVRMPPGWDGIETVARIWEIDAEIQIVLCTAFSDYSWDQMEQKLGQPDRLLILKKPFDNVEVLQFATALTEKWRLQRRVHAQVGQLEEMVRRRTAELSRSEERYRLITENAADLIAIVEADGRPVYQSPSWERLFGPVPGTPDGTGFFDLLHPDDRAPLTAATHACLQHGTPHACDLRVRRADGGWLTFETHAGPFRNQAGQVEGVLLVSRDATERRKLELQLRQAQKLESIGQLATGVAHEINTPTQYINDNTHFLQGAFASLQSLLARYDELLAAAESGAIAPERLTAVRAARAAADLDYLAVEIPKTIAETLHGVARTAKIVKAMRNFAHPGSAQKTAVNLRDLMDDALTITRHEWRFLAETTTECDPGLPPVPVFPGEFSQVLLNLIVNATHTIADRVGDSRRDKGTIALSARRDGDWVEIRVRDTGLGIPEKVRDRIYDPFFTTKPLGQGTGQGLAIARSIVVDLHRGALTFETAMGIGTVFVIRLPLHLDSTDRPAPAGRPSP